LEIKVLTVVQNFAASVYGYMSDVLVGGTTWKFMHV